MLLMHALLAAIKLLLYTVQLKYTSIAYTVLTLCICWVAKRALLSQSRMVTGQTDACI